jgi:hypothetical protein
MYVVDVKDDPMNPKIVKTIEPDELHRRIGYSRPHTSHCGPEGLYVSALGAPDGGGPGGVFLMDHETFELKGQWEIDRGPQQLAYDVWWNIGYDTLLTSEWGMPSMARTACRPSCCSAAGTATTCTSGTSSAVATSRPSTSAPSSRWCSSCARRTTRARPTGSSASSSRPPI